MPTDQPSSAPQADAPQPTDDLTAAAVLHDEALDRPPGGGGLGGASAAAEVGQAGAASPNSPIDAPTPHSNGDARAAAEARRLATGEGSAEPGHASR